MISLLPLLNADGALISASTVNRRDRIRDFRRSYGLWTFDVGMRDVFEQRGHRPTIPRAGYLHPMSVTTRYESISVGDESFDAYCAVPEAGGGPGVIMFQEIFGINDNMRGLADRMAAAGYVVLVPDMFWRIERRFERQDEAGMADAFAIVQQFDSVAAVGDIQATHAHLLAMPECSGRVGVMGFCLGGGLAFAAATMSRVDGRGPDAAVCYYGSAINDMLGQVGSLDCPTLFHNGDNDSYIPAEKIAEVEAAVSGREGVELHRYDAGHAFSNWDAPSMYDEAAATEAWSRSLDFLETNLR
jgi:carboxymethylenebutenolidase